MSEKNLDFNYIKHLEAEAIFAIRETVAEFKNPVMLYSIGKDSSVLLHLAVKAFYPAKLPFPLLHIDTGFKFPEMISFRDQTVKKIGAKLIVARNTDSDAEKLTAKDACSDHYIYLKKTKPLLKALIDGKFDAAIGGSRREEEKSRAKERFFSVRKDVGGWDPKNQRPELWHLYNAQLKPDQTMRIFPLSNWTEADIWTYIWMEKIEIVPLYFAQIRKVYSRNGILVRVDEFNQPEEGDEVREVACRYRTLGCSPSTGAVISEAANLEQIIEEISAAKNSERQNRAIDSTSADSMEKKKKEGYF